MMRAMCGIQLKDRKISKELILMLNLNETIYYLAMASSVHLYGDVLWVANGHVLRRALDFDLKRTSKKLFEEEGMKVGLSMDGPPCWLMQIVGINLITTRLR